MPRVLLQTELCSAKVRVHAHRNPALSGSEPGWLWPSRHTVARLPVSEVAKAGKQLLRRGRAGWRGQDLDAHGLECHAPLPQTLRAYTGSTAYLGTCVAHLSWCRLRHVVLQQRPACEESCGSVGEPLTVPDEVGLPQLHFRCLESISLSGQPLQIGVLKRCVRCLSVA